MTIGIVIPFYKNKKQLDKCKSAIKKTEYKDLAISIQDNSKENLGFTKAVNNGIIDLWTSVEKYFIILNQDCYLAKDSIANMVKFMDEHPNCAIGGIKQISDSNKDFIIHGGCSEAFPAGRHVSGSVKRGDCAESKQMPWVNGACMIVSKEHIKRIGLMDENFFLIGSDSDWSYTARDRGLEVWYIADAECIHESGESSKPSSEKIENIMKLDIVHWRDKWITDCNYKELSKEIFT